MVAIVAEEGGAPAPAMVVVQADVTADDGEVYMTVPALLSFFLLRQRQSMRDLQWF